MNEEWRAVPGYEELYQVSSLGRVRRIPGYVETISKHGTPCFRRFVGGAMKTHPDGDGYLTVTLTKKSVPQKFKVGRLVATAFIGPRPDGMHTCHCDGVKTNDSIDNLRYDTQAANEADKRKHGTLLRGETHSQAKLTEAQAREILSRKGAASGIALAAKFGVSKDAIERIWSGKNWAHLARPAIDAVNNASGGMGIRRRVGA